jgi:DNA-binding NarL/FixJ family response regulator
MITQKSSAFSSLKMNYYTGKDRPVQRVLIVQNDLLLGAGVESLLGCQPDFTVIGVSFSDEIALMTQIKQLQPHIIVLDKATPLNTSLKLLADLLDHPKWRVVVVSANDNLVVVYDKQQVLATQATDLVSLIRNSFNMV